MRNRLQVIGVDAQPISAQVVKMKAMCDRTMNKFVRKFVRAHISVVPKVAIPLSLHRAAPEPTTRIGFGENLLKESFTGSTGSFVPTHARNIHTSHNVGK